jgi:hypothetical protein
MKPFETVYDGGAFSLANAWVPVKVSAEAIATAATGTVVVRNLNRTVDPSFLTLNNRGVVVQGAGQHRTVMVGVVGADDDGQE